MKFPEVCGWLLLILLLASCVAVPTVDKRNECIQRLGDWENGQCVWPKTITTPKIQRWRA